MSDEHHADERAPLGRALADARVARGLSVADVAAAINLRETVVRAMEDDDFTPCGGHVYARGHLRAFAKQVGLDPAPLLAAYAERHGGAGPRPVGAAPSREPVSAPAAPLSPPARGRLSRDVPLERRGPNWALVVGAALAVVVVLLVVQLVGDLRRPGRGTSEVASPVGTSTTSPTGTPSAAPTTGATPTATSTPGSSPGSSSGSSSGGPGVAADGVAIALRATGESWVSVRDAAGRTVFSGLLNRGDARRFRDGKALRLTLGNAGAVQLTVNGKRIGSAGDDGQVVRLRFGPDDPA